MNMEVMDNVYSTDGGTTWLVMEDVKLLETLEGKKLYSGVFKAEGYIEIPVVCTTKDNGDYRLRAGVEVFCSDGSKYIIAALNKKEVGLVNLRNGYLVGGGSKNIKIDEWLRPAHILEALGSRSIKIIEK